MMFETLIFFVAAAASAQAAPAAGQAGTEASRAASPAVIEMTYDAFVALEETPGLNEISRAAIVAAPDGKRAIVRPAGTAWIS